MSEKPVEPPGRKLRPPSPRRQALLFGFIGIVLALVVLFVGVPGLASRTVASKFGRRVEGVVMGVDTIYVMKWRATPVVLVRWVDSGGAQHDDAFPVDIDLYESLEQKLKAPAAPPPAAPTMRPRLTSTAFQADDMEALDRELKKLAAQVKEREARVAQAGAPAPPPVPSAPPAPPTVMVCYLESTPSVAGLVEDGGHFRHSVFIYAFVGVFLVLVVAAASANGRRPRSR